MQYRRCFASAMLAAAMVVALDGCAPVGMAISKPRISALEDSIEIKEPRADILKIVSDVGTTMNMETMEINKNEGTVTLHAAQSMLAGMMLGAMSDATITVQVKDAGRQLNINVHVMGNFGEGQHDAADKLANDFKVKLAARLTVK